MSKEINISDTNMLEKARKLPLIQLREKADEGDALASLFLGEKRLESKSEEERKKGTHLIIEALNSMEDDYVNGDITKEFFVDAMEEGIDVLLNSYNRHDGFVSQEVFKLCQNIHELDSTKTKGLGICYEKGVGCESDAEKAMYYKEQAAKNGTFIEKTEVFIDCIKKNKLINGVVWAQRALSSEDASCYPKLNARIRLWLAENRECDDKGNSIDINQTKSDYECNSTSNYKEAECLYSLAKTDNEKLEYARLGALHDSELKSFYEDKIRTIRQKEEQDELERKNKERQSKIRRIVMIIAATTAVFLVVALIVSSIISSKKEREREIKEKEQKLLVEQMTKDNKDVLGDWYSSYIFSDVYPIDQILSLTISEDGRCIATKNSKEGTFVFDAENNLLSLNVGQNNDNLVVDGTIMYENIDSDDECIYAKDSEELKQLLCKRIDEEAQASVVGTYERNLMDKPTYWLYINKDRTWRHYDKYNEEEIGGTWTTRTEFEENNITVTLILQESGTDKVREHYIPANEIKELRTGGSLKYVNNFSRELKYDKK